ncbi:DinB family protein [Chloroflexota bacterium]
MEWRDLTLIVFERMSKDMEAAFEGLTVEDINRQPTPETNSIGWLSWHLSRAQDRGLTEISDFEQLWEKDEWYVKFNMPANPQDVGAHHTPEDLATFKAPEPQVLMDYYHAVVERTKNFITELPEAELGRKIDHWKYENVGVRLAGIVHEGYIHIGQIEYLHGLFKGMGWHV